MRALIKCSRCGRFLGYYEGEEYIIEVKPFFTEIRILCKECYEKKRDQGE